MFLVVAFEVVQVAELARLRHSFARSEPLLIEELDAVVYVVKVTHIQQYCADSSASSAFAAVAVDDNHALRVSFDPLDGSLSDAVQVVEGGPVMVRPMVVSHAVEEFLFVVGGTLRRI